jgi:hypothetical protein
MVRGERNPVSKEAAMSLPSMTTAFCLSGIAGLALTSAAMPPIGDGSPHSHTRCQMAVQDAPCAHIQKLTEKPGHPVATAPDASDPRSHCQTIAAEAKERMPMQFAANCGGANTISAASRLD